MEHCSDNSIVLTLTRIEEFRILHFVMTSMGDAVVLSPLELQKKIIDSAEKIIKKQEKHGSVSHWGTELYF